MARSWFASNVIKYEKVSVNCSQVSEVAYNGQCTASSAANVTSDEGSCTPWSTRGWALLPHEPFVLSTYINDPENKDEPDVADFNKHMLAKSNDTVYIPPNAGRRLSAVTSRLHRRIVDQMLLMAPTTFAASNLKGVGYQADVVIVDEASQATKPDIINVLLGQSNVILVLLLGDEQQFGPVIKSFQAISNP